MTMSVELLWSLPETALTAAYAEARRRYVEKKFERDTQRARLEWMGAKLFVNTHGKSAGWRSTYPKSWRARARRCAR
ncbi:MULTISPECIES: hypothetical protein [unclassified Bradyrhizobium]|uniref:hypothetical protein n=1 Tax=unclassified Bradyrhizobium TaxID=2631580 RepID=UPI001FFAD5C0|nr:MULTISPECIES: hypothetical protein [unclassified Bradyrhizobium]